MARKMVSDRFMYMFLLFALVILAFLTVGDASDPDPLQDFCVAVNDSKVFVNGKVCKDPETVTPDDFSYSGLNRRGNITNPVGTKVTSVFINQLAGLNTLGISIVRIDFDPNGLNPPHHHPRATEILVVVEGTLYAGFITSNPSDAQLRNKLYAKVLYPGDVFVFPRGLIHFQLNIENTKAYAFAALNSQNPGVVTTANALFGTEPLIYPDILTKAFNLDQDIVAYLQSLPWTHSN